MARLSAACLQPRRAVCPKGPVPKPSRAAAAQRWSSSRDAANQQLLEQNSAIPKGLAAAKEAHSTEAGRARCSSMEVHARSLWAAIALFRETDRRYSGVTHLVRCVQRGTAETLSSAAVCQCSLVCSSLAPPE
jgi:hypothetical protein